MEFSVVAYRGKAPVTAWRRRREALRGVFLGAPPDDRGHGEALLGRRERFWATGRRHAADACAQNAGGGWRSGWSWPLRLAGMKTADMDQAALAASLTEARRRRALTVSL
jgi:hypothetical protein